MTSAKHRSGIKSRRTGAVGVWSFAIAFLYIAGKERCFFREKTQILPAYRATGMSEAVAMQYLVYTHLTPDTAILSDTYLQRTILYNAIELIFILVKQMEKPCNFSA